MKKSILSRSLLSPFFGGCFALLVSALPVTAAVVTVDYTMSGTQTNSLWTNLGTTNPNGLAPDNAGGGTIAVGGTGYSGNFGFYAWSGDYNIGYSITTTQAAAFDIQNAVIQFDASLNPDFDWTFNGGPVLSYRIGSDWFVLPADTGSGYTGLGEIRNTFGALTYSGHAWQWDLSGVVGTVAEVSIFTPIPLHTSVAGAFIEVSSEYNDLSSNFIQAVPEPSRALLSVFALGLIAMRRKRKQ